MDATERRFDQNTNSTKSDASWKPALENSVPNFQQIESQKPNPSPQKANGPSSSKSVALHSAPVSDSTLQPQFDPKHHGNSGSDAGALDPALAFMNSTEPAFNLESISAKSDASLQPALVKNFHAPGTSHRAVLNPAPGSGSTPSNTSGHTVDENEDSQMDAMDLGPDYRSTPPSWRHNQCAVSTINVPGGFTDKSADPNPVSSSSQFSSVVSLRSLQQPGASSEKADWNRGFNSILFRE